jgi:hypothetical protein
MSTDDWKFIQIWAIEKYDEIVGRHPEGITVDETRYIFAHEYATAVEAGEIPRVPLPPDDDGEDDDYDDEEDRPR